MKRRKVDKTENAMENQTNKPKPTKLTHVIAKSIQTMILNHLELEELGKSIPGVCRAFRLAWLSYRCESMRTCNVETKLVPFTFPKEESIRNEKEIVHCPPLHQCLAMRSLRRIRFKTASEFIMHDLQRKMWNALKAMVFASHEVLEELNICNFPVSLDWIDGGFPPLPRLRRLILRDRHHRHDDDDENNENQSLESFLRDSAPAVEQLHCSFFHLNFSLCRHLARTGKLQELKLFIGVYRTSYDYRTSYCIEFVLDAMPKLRKLSIVANRDSMTDSPEKDDLEETVRAALAKDTFDELEYDDEVLGSFAIRRSGGALRLLCPDFSDVGVGVKWLKWLPKTTSMCLLNPVKHELQLIHDEGARHGIRHLCFGLTSADACDFEDLPKLLPASLTSLHLHGLYIEVGVDAWKEIVLKCPKLTHVRVDMFYIYILLMHL